MAKFSLTIVCALLAVMWAAVVFAVEERWPNVDCHKKYHNKRRANHHAKNKDWWDRCQNLPRFPCPKVCQLVAGSIVGHKFAKYGNITFFPSKSAHYIGQELGYNDGDGTKADFNLLDEIEKDMDQCNLKYKDEIRLLSIYDRCDRWMPFIKCFHDAIGCP